MAFRGDREPQPVRGRRVLGAPHAAGFALATVLLVAGPARAEVRLPPGFSAQVYVTGQGFESGRAARGIPATSTLVVDDALWVGADGSAEAPWQHGPGEIWRVPRDGTPTLLLRGPMPAGIAVSAGGYLLVADRQGSELFALTPGGQRIPFLSYTQGDAPRGLAFAPDTPETRRAGLAGSLFVATINVGAWPVNDVVQIFGPFDELIRQRTAASSP